eukprot:427844-Prorocentrum_minimum.AAC.3
MVIALDPLITARHDRPKYIIPTDADPETQTANLFSWVLGLPRPPPYRGGYRSRGRGRGQAKDKRRDSNRPKRISVHLSGARSVVIAFLTAACFGVVFNLVDSTIRDINSSVTNEPFVGHRRAFWVCGAH